MMLSKLENLPDSHYWRIIWSHWLVFGHLIYIYIYIINKNESAELTRKAPHCFLIAIVMLHWGQVFVVIVIYNIYYLICSWIFVAIISSQKLGNKNKLCCIDSRGLEFSGVSISSRRLFLTWMALESLKNNSTWEYVIWWRNIMYVSVQVNL